MKTRGVSAGSRSLSRCVVVASCAGFALASFSALPGDARAAEVSASGGLRENPRGACILVTSDGAALRGEPTDKGKILDKLAQGQLLHLSPGKVFHTDDWFSVYEFRDESGGMVYLHHSYGVPDFYVRKKDVKRVDCPWEEAKELSADEEFVKLCEEGTAEEVKQALANGANPNAKDEYGWTAIERAVDNDNLPAFQVLQDAGAKMSDAAFISLCGKGTEDQVRKALKDGANPNAARAEGHTPLMSARGNPGAAKSLLAAGADVNLRRNDNLETALMMAAWSFGHPEVVRALIAAGADVNARDKDGKTALHWAMYSKSAEEVVKALLAAGADPSLKDKNGHDALWYARQSGDKELIRLLGGDGKKSAPKRR